MFRSFLTGESRDLRALRQGVDQRENLRASPKASRRRCLKGRNSLIALIYAPMINGRRARPQVCHRKNYKPDADGGIQVTT